MKRRIIALILALTMLSALTVHAEDVTSGSCGSNVRWELADGTLTISGTGPMRDFSYAGTPWQNWTLRSTIERVVVKPGVTHIGNYAFHICTALTDVQLPDTLTSIGEYAFSDCYSLVFVEIPDSVTSLGRAVFNKCSSLRDVTLPDTLTAIPYGAFYSSGVRFVSLPAAVTSVDRYAFEYSRLIEVGFAGTAAQWANVAVADNNDVLNKADVRFGGEDVFTGASGDCGDLRWRVDADGRLTISGEGAMMDYESIGDHPWAELRRFITSVEVESGVTRVGDYAFNDCFFARQITLPDTVTSVGAHAFEDTEIEEMVFPDSVTEVGAYALAYCPRLTSVRLSNHAPSLPDSFLYQSGALKELTLPEGLTSIGNSAISFCRRLKELTIPASVTNIRQNAFNGNTDLAVLDFEGPLPTLGAENVFAAPTHCKAEYYDSYKAYFLEHEVKRPLFTGDSPVELSASALELSQAHPEEQLTVSPVLETDWTSDAPDSVSVDADGTVRATGHGYALIHGEAHGNDGVTLLTCEVTSQRNDLLVEQLPKELTPDFPVYANATMGSFERPHGYQTAKFIEHDTSNEYYQALVQEVEAITAGCATDREKAVAIQKWVSKNVSYEGAIGMGSSVEQVYQTYISRTGHCEGFAKLTGFMLYLAGIPNGICVNIGHMWNIALVEDGWMMVDSTWGESGFDYDDPEHGMIVYIGFGEGDCCMIVNTTEGVKLGGVGERVLTELREGITEVVVPEYVDIVAQDAFYCCTGLETVSLPRSVKTVDDAFPYNCRALKTIRFGGTAEEWDAVSKEGNNTAFNDAEVVTGAFDVYVREGDAKLAVLASYDAEGCMTDVRAAGVDGLICRFELDDDALSDVRLFLTDDGDAPVSDVRNY